MQPLAFALPVSPPSPPSLLHPLHRFGPPRRRPQWRARASARRATPSSSSSSFSSSSASSPSSPSPAPSPSSAHAARVFQPVTWPDVERLTLDLATQARSPTSGGPFDVVLAVTRGGLVPATLLSERLGLRNVLAATVMFYSDDGERFFGMTEPRFLAFPPESALHSRRILVVDDVWDSGRTMRAVCARVRRAQPELVRVAVMHFKPARNTPNDGTVPDFFATTTDDWIVYPWENVVVRNSSSADGPDSNPSPPGAASVPAAVHPTQLDPVVNSDTIIPLADEPETSLHSDG